MSLGGEEVGRRHRRDARRVRFDRRDRAGTAGRWMPGSRRSSSPRRIRGPSSGTRTGSAWTSSRRRRLAVGERRDRVVPAVRDQRRDAARDRLVLDRRQRRAPPRSAQSSGGPSRSAKCSRIGSAAIAGVDERGVVERRLFGALDRQVQPLGRAVGDVDAAAARAGRRCRRCPRESWSMTNGQHPHEVRVVQRVEQAAGDVGVAEVEPHVRSVDRALHVDRDRRRRPRRRAAATRLCFEVGVLLVAVRVGGAGASSASSAVRKPAGSDSYRLTFGRVGAVEDDGAQPLGMVAHHRHREPRRRTRPRTGSTRRSRASRAGRRGRRRSRRSCRRRGRCRPRRGDRGRPAAASS